MPGKHLVGINSNTDYVCVAGDKRLLTGCLPKTSSWGKSFSEDFQVLPENEWRKVDLRQHVKHIFDQDGTNGCNANACIQAAQIISDIEGNEPVVYSPASIYKRINGGRDQGSAIADGLKALSKYGALPASLMGENDWRSPWPSNADAIASAFKVLEWTEITNIAEAGTVLSSGLPFVVGVAWGTGAHAICILDIDWNFVNSWGKNYGDQGFGTLTRDRIARGIPVYGAWAPRVVTLTA